MVDAVVEAGIMLLDRGDEVEFADTFRAGCVEPLIGVVEEGIGCRWGMRACGIVRELFSRE